MRAFPVLAVILISLVSAGAAGADSAPSPAEPHLFLDVRCSWNTGTWSCRFTVRWEGANLLFFGFDFDNDGRFEVVRSSQTVAWADRPTGTWTAHAVGWDGASTYLSEYLSYTLGGDVSLIDGAFVVFRPTPGYGWWFDSLASATLEGIPARRIAWWPSSGKNQTIAFQVPYLLLLQRLGPGVHMVNLRGTINPWFVFTAAGTVELP